MERTSLTLNVPDDVDVCLVVDKHDLLDLYSDSSLKQQPAGRHVTPHDHIILIPIKRLYCCYFMLRA